MSATLPRMTSTTVTDSVPEIVTSITTNAAGDEHHDHDDDDQRWIETVLASLPTRSREAQQALAKALSDGDMNVTAPVGAPIFLIA